MNILIANRESVGNRFRITRIRNVNSMRSRIRLGITRVRVIRTVMSSGSIINGGMCLIHLLLLVCRLFLVAIFVFVCVVSLVCVFALVLSYVV